MKLKYCLPTYGILEHICIDQIKLNDLINCVHELESEFKSVLEINKELCGIHHELVKNVYDNFFQIALTDTSVNNQEITLDECEISHTQLNQSGNFSSYKRKKSLVIDETSVFNEAKYTIRTEIYNRYKSLFDHIIRKIKGNPTRIRLVKLSAGSSISPHIDYDPSYAVRIIIPIISDQNCVNLFWIKNSLESVSLVPGNAYFLNTGFKHAVINFSKHDRYTLMISVNGTEDIQPLLRSL